MAAATLVPGTASATAPTTLTVRKVTLRRVLRSEWSKFWSLRSSWITLVASVVVLIAFGVIAAAVYAHSAKHSGTSEDPVSLALVGASLSGLIVGVLGVLMSAGEYGTGMVRSTFVAVPRRWPVLAAKSAVIGALTLVLTTFGALLAFGIGAVSLHGDAIALTLGDHGVLRSLAGAGVYLGLFAVFGVALGSLVRSMSGSIAALVGFLMLLPGLAAVLPGSMQDNVKPYLPSNAGEAIFALHRGTHSLSPGAGLAVFATWTAVVLAAAAVRLKRADV
ncbi:ABC-2 type transport system permease protein [Catenulispora sp. EB89]|uniref:ABC transporter permease n=1 Tax=Catenulispora sp. EB89 TaxID=3156257 RepID=UPI0035114187